MTMGMEMGMGMRVVEQSRPCEICAPSCRDCREHILAALLSPDHESNAGFSMLVNRSLFRWPTSGIWTQQIPEIPERKSQAKRPQSLRTLADGYFCDSQHGGSVYLSAGRSASLAASNPCKSACKHTGPQQDTSETLVRFRRHKHSPEEPQTVLFIAAMPPTQLPENGNPLLVCLHTPSRYLPSHTLDEHPPPPLLPPLSLLANGYETLVMMMDC